jgi:2-keto-4-pentenoate hydratase/2-oxohepta-3-ene-1,7-dioic acid hydratase in catechol pathway
MKVVVFGPERCVGVLLGEQVIDLAAASASLGGGSTLPGDLAGLIEAGPRGLDAAQTVAERAVKEGDAAFVQPLSAVKLQRPDCGPAARIACAGGNFARHVAGMRPQGGGEPVTLEQAAERIRGNGFWGFWKIVRQGAGPDGDVIYPARTERLERFMKVGDVVEVSSPVIGTLRNRIAPKPQA